MEIIPDFPWLLCIFCYLLILRDSDASFLSLLSLFSFLPPSLTLFILIMDCYLVSFSAT